MNTSIKTNFIPNKPESKHFFIDVAFLIYIYMMTVANHTVFLRIAIVILIISTLCICLKKKHIYFSWYFILELLFIGYGFYQIRAGMVLFIDDAKQNLNTLLICAAIDFTVYNFIILRKDFNRILSLYAESIIFGVITLFIFGWRSLLVGRFLHDENYKFFGQVANASSNGTGIVAAIAFIICIYLFWREHKFKCIAINSILLICIFLTGSRKAIGLAAVGTFMVLYYINPTKKLRNIMAAGCVFIIGYLFIMNVPIFYELLGSRIENTMNYILVGSTDENSMKTRINLINMGMDYIKLNPTYGYGLANYYQIVTRGGYYSHNNFIEILFSGGIIGFIIYYCRYVLVFTKAAASKMRKDTTIKLLLSLFVILTVLEYWLVTYYERNYMIFHIFILAFCKLNKSKHELQKVKNCNNAKANNNEIVL